GIAPVTKKGKHNKLIAERNQLVATVELVKNQKPHVPILFKRNHDERNRQTIQTIKWTEQALADLSGRDTETARSINDVSERIDSTKRLIAKRSEAIKHSAAPTPYDTDYERAFFERKRQA